MDVATGSAADPRKVARVESQGARVLRAGEGVRVTGGGLIDALAQEAHWNVAMIGGGEMLDTLIADDALDRLYLTLACRMFGGVSFDTLLTSPTVGSAGRFRLEALHYDAQHPGGSDVEQLFAILARSVAPTVQTEGSRRVP